MVFFSKDETTDFNADTANNNVKSFKYKTELLENTVAKPAPNAANGILKIATVVVPLKYLNNFWRSLEIALINCKVKLKIKWAKYCVLSADGNEYQGDNDKNFNSNRIIFTIKDTNL